MNIHVKMLNISSAKKKEKRQKKEKYPNILFQLLFYNTAIK